ncbi:MAG: KUP/HAK/KT family potassium transporter [Actinomycetes bacterium]
MSATVKKAVAGAGMVAALGVVFGDIGTSPLYAMGLLFSPNASHHVPITEDNVLGILSAVMWLVTIVVTIKYAMFILRADNHGEGGTVALVSLLREKLSPGRLIGFVTVVGFAGMALFLGDAVITPAISVLSAVEGVKVVVPGFASFVVPVVLIILVVLFTVQRAGTAKIGRLFGPTMSVWFGVLAITGLWQIAANPKVLWAINPLYAARFVVSQPVLFFAVLSILLLSITGVEALYADLGHFGRPPIVRAWLLAAFPALMLNYFGQGALLLRTDGPIDNLFFSMVPSVLVVPLVIIATVATIIAAQAVISGGFSLVSQATKLSYLPRIVLKYPSGEHGQVYVPVINWILFTVVCAIVIAFGASEALADAYGISVVACMLGETLLFFIFVRKVWGKSVLLVVLGIAFFGTVDLALLFSCLPKIKSGGWFPLVIASAVFTALWTWHTARSYLRRSREAREGDLEQFITHINTDQVNRLAATAVYMHPNRTTVPISMRAVHDIFGVVNEHTLIVTVHIAEIPEVSPSDRFAIDNLGYDDGIWHVTLNFGFNELIDVPAALEAVIGCGDPGLAGVDVQHATYYVSKFETDHVDIPDLPRPLERLFVALKDAETDLVPFYHLPPARTVTLGTVME